ncbi:hypothetical protein H257_01653 [Aphanomyces astaci]|uniref:START domain-containing protein n=1 Tax=Aphanomyces astaci TaxID=112090 RepID=W4H361_APHAT|nr:hypothetical protein H257_01653 [Aphanomyces astaci]ETV86460.1 hypothetical protein H257_01653 [Aphanomyces astaci]RHY12449.1 hypothetical protein DYB25_005644 [Aphanomyces astaci]RHY12802.1 hypothetical protein DYB36_009079 [Aphanomyces astaci]RHY47031.1 hypothetical protein DYB30_003802 [Aphanomyces astaci]RHY54673.1 hypothetical protein DYB38_008622 [Aphanomyces astaci]|eukprot:XP_009823259.1 hypothetical protein H257_01653 [Aphanomyces astaci]
MKFPLPIDYFQCPTLSVGETNKFKAQAKDNVTSLVSTAVLRGGSVAWVLLSDETELKIYKATDRLRGLSMYISRSTVVGTLDEVVDVFQTHTTELIKDCKRRVGKDLLDVATLYDFNPPHETSTINNVGIIYAAMKSPPFVADRDSVMLECRSPFQDKSRRGWCRSLISVEVEGCPPFPGMVRAHQYGSGHLFLESTRRGYVELSYISHVDYGAVVPIWIEDMANKKRCRNLITIDRCLRENRLRQGQFLTKVPMAPGASLDSFRYCFLCTKPFRLFRKKSFCCKCGQVLCTGCNLWWQLNINGMMVAIQACLKCAQRSTTTHTMLPANHHQSNP